MENRKELSISGEEGNAMLTSPQKIKIEIVVSENRVEDLIDTVVKNAATER
ncbi:hypothetical protein [Methanococcoides alaskense]|uniref:Nitrogen regulatory protein PII n=1 Tax=Methanococcoides alaskense TaxID=325778 RepID=A0AA90TX36_9EURY|nr:hypothetical protein [Methanococcoides alaskense]MDR6221594.1 nitrogen regulatory protein PII [Methanococcoides alaskense]